MSPIVMYVCPLCGIAVRKDDTLEIMRLLAMIDTLEKAA